MAKTTIRDVGKIRETILTDSRHLAFKQMLGWMNMERVEGDIFEFGVGTGHSLILLAFLQNDWINRCPEWFGDEENHPYKRKFIGFDSFEGLPFDEGHKRWHKGMFRESYRLNHPWLERGEKIKPQYVHDLFATFGYELPQLEVGLFSETIPKVIPRKYNRAAMIHINSNLYESCKDVLDNIGPLLQQGTVLMFNEYFAFQASPKHGEQRAFREFLEENPHITALEYKQYSRSSKSFIICKDDDRSPIHL